MLRGGEGPTHQTDQQGWRRDGGSDEVRQLHKRMQLKRFGSDCLVARVPKSFDGVGTIASRKNYNNVTDNKDDNIMMNGYENQHNYCLGLNILFCFDC